MFTKILTSALFAGALAGLIGAALQFTFVQPVLLQAELYETGALVHFGEGAGTGDAQVAGFDLMRDAMSVFFTMLIYCGYGLMLVALMSVAEAQGVEITAKSGIIWGLAGFVTMHLAPAVSLPPEVPGAAAAETDARQIWWFVCVFATGISLWLIAFGKSWMSWGPATLLILSPHLYGAPEPSSFTGPAPPELAALFSSRALGIGAAVWAILGCLAAYFWAREEQE